MLEADPMSFVLRHKDLDYYAQKFYEVTKDPYVSKYTDFPGVPAAIQAWVDGDRGDDDRQKALVIWGPSRTGKTVYARSLDSVMGENGALTYLCFYNHY